MASVVTSNVAQPTVVSVGPYSLMSRTSGKRCSQKATSAGASASPPAISIPVGVVLLLEAIA